ncbi:zonular occludens toxin domain-containing protein, partial [Parageobacillus thermoglucosidasius]|uniref:zonular occludens toxin domain-containing protein n=1 Tax=Parageobacillus thermoglucosidasius TaxID=1426 RepID=UPI00242B89DC
MTIELYTGTIGSGKSYHALEDIVSWLSKGKHVIANFPINFSEGMIRKGYVDRFMYIPDEYLMGAQGVIRLYQISMKYFFENGEESQCLVVIDEAG